MHACRSTLEDPTVAAIAPGAGAVVRHGAKKVAAYRDEHGVLHERSAVCTHLKCIVAWNELEKTWDCPCHGARYDPYGEVLNGPAIYPLKSLDEDDGDHEEHERHAHERAQEPQPGSIGRERSMDR